MCVCMCTCVCVWHCFLPSWLFACAQCGSIAPVEDHLLKSSPSHQMETDTEREEGGRQAVAGPSGKLHVTKKGEYSGQESRQAAVDSCLSEKDTYGDIPPKTSLPKVLLHS